MLGVSNEDLIDVVQNPESWEFILEDRDTVMHKTVKVKDIFSTLHCLWEYFSKQIGRGQQVSVWHAQVRP